jgi:hypothetical protein
MRIGFPPEDGNQAIGRFGDWVTWQFGDMAIG